MESRPADLLVTDADLVATVDDARREIPGGWVAVTDGLVSGLGSSADPRPDAVRTIDARGCLVTPGLVLFTLSSPLAIAFNVLIRYRTYFIAYGTGFLLTALAFVLGIAQLGPLLRDLS